MATTDPLNKTVDYLHQLRGSILPIDAVTYNQRHGEHPRANTPPLPATATTPHYSPPQYITTTTTTTSSSLRPASSRPHPHG